MKHILTKLAIVSFDGGDQPNLPRTEINNSTIGKGLGLFFGIAAAVAVLIIAISAFRIVISRGNSQDVQKARDAIIYAAIGLAVSMSGFVIVTFVVDRI